MKTFYSGILGLFFAGIATLQSANAADLYRGSAGGYKDGPVTEVPTQSWTGFYIGGNIGGAFRDNSSWNWDGAQPSPAVNFLFRGGKYDDVLIGGGQVGFNFGRSFVFGIEGDVDFAEHIDYLASVRGKLGAATPSALFYVTGGVAFIGANNNDSMGVPEGWTATRHGGDNETGWVVGGGIEFRPGGGLFFGMGPSLGSNVTFGIEGLYYNFDNNRYWSIADNNGNNYRWDNGSHNDFFTVRAKLNWYLTPVAEPLK